MSIKLPPMPARIARLPKDERGYPTPWFVEWVRQGANGPEPAPIGEKGAEPDFRCMSETRRRRAMRLGACWICGQQLGVHRIFAVGPMCVINRVSSEPPSHRDCAEFAVKACPFLLRPRMKRLPTDDMPDKQSPGGIMLERNPGCIALYQIGGGAMRSGYRAFQAGDGWLIKMDAPERIDWWAEGRPATRAEIMASIDGGYPLLEKLAIEDGPEAVRELEKMRDGALELLPQ